jgi:hypothetical protein
MLTESREARFEAALRNAEEFFMGKAKVQRALAELARTLDEFEIPYAIAGAMALNAYGYERVTTDVDVILTKEGLARSKRASSVANISLAAVAEPRDLTLASGSAQGGNLTGSKRSASGGRSCRCRRSRSLS